MPIREFHCTDCGQEFEKIVRATADPESIPCPTCGGHHLERKFSTFAPRMGAAKSAPAPMACPSGGMCPTPGMCGSRN
ncbi:MAG: zinc ribbon domain-containing protein [Bryobacterales bacterium]|nr:zinc ribbon domain-containing protein [Bryobacterales bacterium]